MRTHQRRRSVAVLGVAAVLGSLLGTAPAAHATTTLTLAWSYKLRAGVKVREYYSASPLIRAFVLSVTPSALGNSTIDNVAAGSTITSVAATSTIANKAKAAAAINGDFGAFIKRVEHAYLQNGELWQTGIDSSNSVFGITAANPYSTNAPTVYIGPTGPHVDLIVGGVPNELAEFNSTIINPGPTQVVHPLAGEIIGYTARGLSKEKPPVSTSTCNVHLTQATTPPDYEWATGLNGVRVSYVVDQTIRCNYSMTAGTGGLVLTSKNSGAGFTTLSSLALGRKVGLRWQYGMPGILDSVGGRPLVVQSGAPAGTGTNGAFVCDLTNPDNLCKNQPRSAVAATQPCTTGTAAGCVLSMVIVDGRQSGWSSGITLDDFASFMINDLNAYDALNFDGGGSATMWVKNTTYNGAFAPWCQAYGQTGSGWTPVSQTGCLVNRPWVISGQTTTERSVVNDLVIRGGPDAGDPSPAP